MSIFWDILYLLKRTPWDTGVTPPEIVAMLDRGRLKVGRALDLGCGTGTNAIYLAQHGFEVTAIDVSRRAIALARRKARAAHLAVRFERGDVSLMTRWVEAHTIEFAYDIGCLHSLSSEARRRYVDGLRSVMKPGAIYMLYAFGLVEGGPRGVSPDEVAARFADGFLVREVQHGDERGARPSAWYTLERV